MTAALQPIHTVGNLLGVKTSSLIAKLTMFTSECAEYLALTVPHGLDGLTATTRMSRARAQELCGRWLDALPGDELEVEVSADGATARSDEAALPAGAPALVSALGELAALGYNGSVWQYVVEHDNADVDATAALLDRIAGEVGVTAQQRKVAGGLHRSLARGGTTRAWLRGKGAALDRVLALAWDAVEWQPIQHMLGGFYPQLGVVSQIPRLQRAAEVDSATVELVLGPTDPPALRITMRVA